MLKIRKSDERGHVQHDWLDTFHTFSFAEYFDRNYMGFRVLRVINEDKVAPGQGFATHGHRDMEIITYVIEGRLQHKDTLGNTTIIKPGEVQYMCAGTGVRHSEFNPDPEKPVHLLQIWILPDKEGYAPAYGQKSYLAALNDGPLVLVASRDGRQDTIKINQDVDLYVGRLRSGEELSIELSSERFGWLQLVRGELSITDVNGHSGDKEISIASGDGVAIANQNQFFLKAQANAEFLYFELP